MLHHKEGGKQEKKHNKTKHESHKQGIQHKGEKRSSKVYGKDI